MKNTPTIIGRSATISECRRYRYTLNRVWDYDRPECTFIMLNPSTADAHQDDPTVRRCIKFADRFGCGSLSVLNLFAYRATKPEKILEVKDPVGRFNDSYIDGIDSDIVVAAWGAKAEKINAVIPMSTLRDLWSNGHRVKCLGMTKHGHPRHPLYVAANTKLINYERKGPP